MKHQVEKNIQVNGQINWFMHGIFAVLQMLKSNTVIYDGAFDLKGNQVNSYIEEFGYEFKNNINSNNIFVRAEDVDGNVFISEYKTIKIDKTKPTAEIYLKYNDSEGRRYDGEWTSSNVYAWYICSSGLSKLNSCDLYDGDFDLDGNLLNYQIGEFGYTFTSEIDTDNIYVRAEDYAGNVTFSEYKGVKIDRTAPTSELYLK